MMVGLGLAWAMAGPVPVAAPELPPALEPVVVGEVLVLDQDARRVAVAARWAPPPDQTQLERLALRLLARTRSQGRRGRRLQAELALLGADVDLRTGPSGATLLVEAPAATLTQATALALEQVEHGGGYRAYRREAKVWARWRAQLWLDLDRVHQRAVNHAWFAPGHAARHAATPDELASLRLRGARRALERQLAEGERRVAVVGAGADTSAIAAVLPTGGRSAVSAPAPSPTAGIHLVDRPGFEVARTSVCVPAPAHSDDRREAFDLAVSTVAGDFTSRASAELREDLGLVYRVDVTGGDGWRCIDTESTAGAAAEVVGRLRDQLASAGDVEDAELCTARARLAVSLASERLHAVDLAGALVAGEAATDGQRAATSALTAAGLGPLVGEWLAPERQVIVVTGDAALIGPELGRLGSMTTVSAEALAEEP